MQLSTRAKLVLKRYVPAPLYSLIRLAADKTVLRILPLYFKYRISDFTKEYFRRIDMGGFSFIIEIRPENGYLDAQIHANGLYEPHIVDVMRQHIKEGDTCLDIGANIGHHAIVMSNFAGESGHVYAYEPIPKLRDQMSRSLVANDIRNVTILDVALSDSEGEMTLHLREGNIGGSSLLSAENTVDLPVRVTTLDREHPGKVDFMKIDVEGYEYHVLMGGRRLIENYRPTVVFEWSPAYYRLHDESHALSILRFFKEHNYRLVDIEDNYALITHFDRFLLDFEPGLRAQTNILATPL